MYILGIANFANALYLDMKINRIGLLSILAFVGTVVFALPFAFKENANDLTVLSVSFTAVGAFASVFTAFIAVALYDKFGIDQRFTAKRIDTVLALIDLLKGKVFTVSSPPYNYLLRLSETQLRTINQLPFYTENSQKKLAVVFEDYQLGVKDILLLKKSYWLPTEIKEKIEFFDFPMVMTIIEEQKNAYAILELGTNEAGKTGILFPEMTFAQFHKHLIELIVTLEKWLKDNSSILLDLKMEEALTYNKTNP